MTVHEIPLEPCDPELDTGHALVVDLRVTRVVNGVHAVLRDGEIG